MNKGSDVPKVTLLNPNVELDTIKRIPVTNEMGLYGKAHIVPILVGINGIPKQALIKYFGHRRDSGAALDTLQQELSGYQTCLKAGINTPEMLAYRNDDKRKFCIVKFEDSTAVHNIVNSMDDFLDILDRSTDIIAKFNQAGMIHHDTDSTNLLYTNNGEILLIDFGRCTENPSKTVNQNDIIGFMDHLAMRSFGVGTESYNEARQIGKKKLIEKFKFPLEG